jgi:hypothetical protein
MGNELLYFNPYFYAQEILILLEKKLGLANRVHRGYEQERRTYKQGEYINIKKPGTFVAQNAPSSTPQDVATEGEQIRLTEWKDVVIALDDKELTFSKEEIIDIHIDPAAYAIADAVDQAIALLYKDVPWYHGVAAASAMTASDVTACWQTLFDNKVPMDPTRLHMMLNGAGTKQLLDSSNFAQWQGSGAEGVKTQKTAELGNRFLFNMFANQNTQAHTPGAITASAPKIKTGAAKGATSVTIYDTTLTGTAEKGDSLVIAGNTQRYAITAPATAASNEITVSITPKIVATVAGDAAVTLRQKDATCNLAFHRNFAALAMAPLPMIGDKRGAEIKTVTEPKTGLSIRITLWYEGKEAKLYVRVDALFGVKTLDPNLAMRLEDELS